MIAKFVNVPETKSRLRSFVSGRDAGLSGRSVGCCPFSDLAPNLRAAWLAGHESTSRRPDHDFINNAPRHLKSEVIEWCEKTVIDMAGGDRAALEWLLRGQIKAAYA